MLFVTAIYSPKNDNKHPSEMRNRHQSGHFAFRPILMAGLKYRLTVTFLQNHFLLTNCPTKNTGQSSTE